MFGLNADTLSQASQNELVVFAVLAPALGLIAIVSVLDVLKNFIFKDSTYLSSVGEVWATVCKYRTGALTIFTFTLAAFMVAEWMHVVYMLIMFFIVILPVMYLNGARKLGQREASIRRWKGKHQ